VLEEPRAELTAVGSVEEALKALVSDIGLRRMAAEPQVRKLEVVTENGF